MTTMRRSGLVIVAAFALAVSACGGDDAADEPVTLTLLAHESFTPTDGIFDAFTAATGIEVQIALGDDAGTLLAQASLTAGNPEGDVLWGVDNTLLSRALDDDVFVTYESPLVDGFDPDLLALVPGREVTPVDTGDVCINYDIAALAERGVEPPTSFEDLTDPRYAGMLVVPSPATSSPGLAFLLGTIAHVGEADWQDYWRALRANDVEVVDGWTEAYYGSFTRAGGDRPLVVSYASSPPAEIVFADPPLPDGSPAPTGVVEATCFGQVEFAGILRGTDHPDEARQLIDFLIGPEFQSDLPLTQFVNPVNPDATIPPVYADNVARPESSLALAPDVIAENRSAWVDEWTSIVLR